MNRVAQLQSAYDCKIPADLMAAAKEADKADAAAAKAADPVAAIRAEIDQREFELDGDNRLIAALRALLDEAAGDIITIAETNSEFKLYRGEAHPRRDLNYRLRRAVERADAAESDLCALRKDLRWHLAGLDREAA